MAAAPCSNMVGQFKRIQSCHLDGSDDEQVLQVVVVAEAAVLQNNLLQQLNELSLQACQHEGLDSH